MIAYLIQVNYWLEKYHIKIELNLSRKSFIIKKIREFGRTEEKACIINNMEILI